MTLQARVHGCSRNARQSGELDFAIADGGNAPERALKVYAECVPDGVELQSGTPRRARLRESVERDGKSCQGKQERSPSASKTHQLLQRPFCQPGRGRLRTCARWANPMKAGIGCTITAVGMGAR